MPRCRFMLSASMRRSMLVLIVGLISSPHAQAAPLSDATWSSIVPGAPTPPFRTEHGAAYDPVAQRMLMFGGNGWSDIWGFDLSGADTWTPLSPASQVPPPTRGSTIFFRPGTGLTQIERVEDHEDHGRQAKAGGQHHENRSVQIALPSLNGSPVFLQDVSPNHR